MYGICNVVGASIPRNTDSGTYIHVGPEIGVASTKAFTGQVTVLMLLALCVGQMRGTVDDATVERIVRELKNMPLYIKDVLGLADKIKNLSKIYTYARNFLYLGRGYNYPTALEGALKLKEISYIHAEGYPAAEMKLFKCFIGCLNIRKDFAMSWEICSWSVSVMGITNSSLPRYTLLI